VLKWGAKARVLAPESLREEICSEIEAMREIYQVL
jgi:predicted DNA-binding transcriptional regulator YafY